jgi:hypothetical protein
MNLQTTIFLLISFRDFVVTTHPLWEFFCVAMTFSSSVFLAIFVRSRCIVLLLGGFCFTFFSYLEMTYACFTLSHSCNTNDVELSIYYDMFIGTFYSAIVLILVRLIVFTIQNRR